MLGFIGISSTIYVTRFDLSEQLFSYFFAANALLFILGPVLYVGLSRLLGSLRVITLCLAGMAVTGALLLTVGGLGPVVFALSMVPASLSSSVIRPPATKLMLEQQDGDIGAASSLITCSWSIFGAVGLAFISLDQFTDKVAALGICAAFVGSIGLIIWLLTRRSIRIPGLEAAVPSTVTEVDQTP
jgi:DHA1 family bicyclomycin/chloramphenicol resistance-like MFS transporter